MLDSVSEYPKISIVIPVYNGEDFIARCLESVLGLTVQIYEVIVVDDGSTDSTVDILDVYSERKNITIIKSDHQGVGPARNRGLKIATGDYIYFCDADDTVSREFGRVLGKYIQEYAYPDIVLFSCDVVFCAENNSLHRSTYDRTKSDAVLSGSDALSWLAERGEDFSLFPLMIVKKSIYDTAALQFDGWYYEDDALFYPLINECKSVIVLDNKLYTYFRRNGSITTKSISSQHIMGLLNVSARCLKYMKNHKEKIGRNVHIWNRRITDYGLRYLFLCWRHDVTPSFMFIKDILPCLYSWSVAGKYVGLIILNLPSLMRAYAKSKGASIQ